MGNGIGMLEMFKSSRERPMSLVDTSRSALVAALGSDAGRAQGPGGFHPN